MVSVLSFATCDRSVTRVRLIAVNVKMPCNLKTLIIGEKQKVLEAVKSGRKKKDIAEEFGIPASTLSTIIKNSKKIDLNSPTNRKRKRGPDFSDVEECVAKWFNQCRNK